MLSLESNIIELGFLFHFLSLDDCQDFNILPIWELKVFESNFYTI
jgi:hypothetical protein